MDLSDTALFQTLLGRLNFSKSETTVAFSGILIRKSIAILTKMKFPSIAFTSSVSSGK